MNQEKQTLEFGSPYVIVFYLEDNASMGLFHSYSITEYDFRFLTKNTESSVRRMALSASCHMRKLLSVTLNVLAVT